MVPGYPGAVPGYIRVRACILWCALQPEHGRPWLGVNLRYPGSSVACYKEWLAALSSHLQAWGTPAIATAFAAADSVTSSRGPLASPHRHRT